jgi:NAD(P)H-hydrate epimerase
MNLPSLTAIQMAEVDRLMIEVYHIQLIQMMENAGRNLADCAIKLTQSQSNPAFLILCGSGNNGGGGLVAARHLLNRGYRVEVVIINGTNLLKEIPRQQWDVLQEIGIQPTVHPDIEAFDLILDAMIGYGLKGAPRGADETWIMKINQNSTPVLSLDIPSGLDATNGTPLNPCTRAAATLTLALPKTGLMTAEAKPYVGDLYLSDISVPNALYKSLGLNVGPIFKHNVIIKVE